MNKEINFKQRLLVEYADLKEKIHKLDDYLADNYERTKSEKEIKVFKLLENQFKAMGEYLNCLEERILLLMGDSNE